MLTTQNAYDIPAHVNNKAASVSTPTTAFVMQYRDMLPCRDLFGGTEAMRRAGERYIRKEDGETNDNWRERVRRTVLRNIFAQTIAYNKGQVFSRFVALDNNDGGTLTDENLESFRAWAEDVDQKGKNLTPWAGDAFTAGLRDGVTFCLVDFPRIETQEQGGVTLYRDGAGNWQHKTAAADKAEGWQPYLVHILAEQVLDCRAEWRKGKRRITHFRYIEHTAEQDPDNPWAEISVAYIHAYWTDRWQVWRRAESDTEYTLAAEGRMTLSEIPLAVFMAGEKRTDFTARPALMDLAWLNIRHWQSTSAQYDLLEYARRPPWYIVGVDGTNNFDADGKPQKLHFGPGMVLYLPQGGAVASAGVNGASIEAGRAELRDLEEAMAAYGLQILQGTGVRATATQVERETRENNSQLRNWALDFQDFLENCLRFVGLWWGLQDGCSVKVNDEFAGNANVDYLLQLADKELISKPTLATLLTRAGVLPDDFNYGDEVPLLAQDTANTVNAGANGTMAGLLERLQG